MGTSDIRYTKKIFGCKLYLSKFLSLSLYISYNNYFYDNEQVCYKKKNKNLTLDFNVQSKWTLQRLTVKGDSSQNCVAAEITHLDVLP